MTPLRLVWPGASPSTYFGARKRGYAEDIANVEMEQAPQPVLPEHFVPQQVYQPAAPQQFAPVPQCGRVPGH